jgi:putative PEP-CTERM system TPR-repeat lipoprotein
VNLAPFLRHALAIALLAGSVLGASAQGTQPAGAQQKAAKLYEDALQRYERKEFAAAAVQLKNVLQLDKKNLSAHLLLGKTLLAAGELKAAEAALEEALKQGVSKAEVGPPLGQVYLLVGEPKKLLETVTTAGIPESLQGEILTLRGSALAMTGNLGAASATLAEARKLNPTSAEPLIAEAPILVRFGEVEKARAVAVKATELAPSNALAWYQLGNIQHTAGDRQGALASLDKALAINPKLVDAQVSRASVLIGLNRAPEAASVLADLKTAKVIEPRASFLRAVLASSAGDEKAAVAEYTEAANRIDAMAPAVRSGSEPLLLAGALSHRALNHRERARDYVDTILTRNAKHFAASVLLASIYLEMGELGRAVPLLENLARAAPNEPQVLSMLGSAYMLKRQYPQAAEMFERASGKNGNNSALRELAFAQFGSGQDKVALANLEKVYAKNPKDLRAGVELAIYHARHGNAERAVAIAEAIVKQDPANTPMLVMLANVKGRLNDKKGMREALDQALLKDPKFKPSVMNLSWLDMEEGRLDDARKRLTTFLKDKPNDVDVLLQLGMLEQQAGRQATALTLWNKADGLRTKDPRPALASIDLLLSQGKADVALPAAKTLFGRFPDLVPVHQALGRTYLAMGDLAMARSAFQDAVKYSQGDPNFLISSARLQLAANQPDAATYTAGKALQAQPDNLGALILIVEAAARKGDAAGVDAAMRALNAKHAGKAPVLVTAGHVAFSRRQLPQAIELYKKAYALEPVGTTAAVLAQAYMANKEPEKALAALETWTAKNPRDFTALRGQAEIQALLGKSDAARASYNQVLAATPEDPDVLSGYSMMLFRMNDPGALVAAEKATKLAPQNAGFASRYGWMLVQKGDVDNGVRVLRDAKLRDPSSGVLRWQLANALSKAGKKAEAKDELRAALASSTPPPPGPELTQLKTELGL